MFIDVKLALFDNIL